MLLKIVDKTKKILSVILAIVFITGAMSLTTFALTDAEKQEYQNKIADMEFNAVLESAITKSGAKNPKAVRGLLDLDTLKASKNQADDITKALETVKSENDYMFTSKEPIKNPVKDTGNPQIGGNEADNLLRASMGLPPKKE